MQLDFHQGLAYFKRFRDLQDTSELFIDHLGINKKEQ